MNAIDSCISLSINHKKVDVRTLYTLLERAEYFYETGEYSRAFDLAVIGENLVKQYLHSEDSVDYMMSISGTKINCLLRTFDFNQAELISANAVQDYKKLKLDKYPKFHKYLGMFYSQLSEATMGKGSFKQAENYFKLSYEWNFNKGKQLECAQTLNESGIWLIL